MSLLIVILLLFFKYFLYYFFLFFEAKHANFILLKTQPFTGVSTAEKI